MKALVTTAVSFVMFGAVADAQVAEPPKMSHRPGCAGLTGAECNERIRKIHKHYPMCQTWECARRVRIRRQHRAHLRYEREWSYWSGLYIPSCTWANESSGGYYGEQFARWRYSVMNSIGSGARGKYQMMPGTYVAYGKYDDWSMLDQEIAAHLLYQAQGTAPWSGC